MDVTERANAVRFLLPLFAYLVSDIVVYVRSASFGSAMFEKDLNEYLKVLGSTFSSYLRIIF